MKDILELMRQNSSKVGFICDTAIKDAIKRDYIITFRDNSRTIAYLLHGSLKKSECRIFQLVVSKKYRNQQLGTKMLLEFYHKLKLNGVSKARIRVHQDYDVNKFWSKQGFRVVEREEHIKIYHKRI